MFRLFIVQFICLILIESKIEENNFKDANQFLNNKISFENKYEQTREIIETTRESCLDEYRQQQQQKIYQRRQILSPFCKKYCTETMDCEQENEQSACINPLWPSRILKYVQKYQRICYIRITEVLRYDRAEHICHQYGLNLAIIDNIHLLEQLKQMNMFNTTCKGQCPEARGYYIGLKRVINDNNQLSSKWIWSNNVTWTENETNCDDDYIETSFANASLLCYIGSNGEKKVTVWNIGEPNNHRYNDFQRGEECVEIITRSDKNGSIEQIGKLNDIPCTKPTLGVICQMEDLKPINSSRFEYFATIIGYNETKNKENDLLNKLFSNFEGSIEANLDVMSAITEALEGLLILPSFTTKQASNILNIVDQLVNITGQIEILDNDNSLKIVTNKLLHFLDLFPVKIQIENEQGTSFKYENMNTSLVNINFNQWYENDKDNEWFTITTENSDDYPNSIIEINMRILREQLGRDNNYRIIETIFSNFNLFPQMNKTNQTKIKSNNNNNNNQLFGIPISYQIVNWTINKTNEDLVRFQIRISEILQSTNLSCAYWSFEKNNGSWIIDNGCRFVGYINNYAQCYCNHLTHFALLMLPESERIEESLTTIEEFLLTFVTYIGIALSIFGLIITLITYALFRCSQKNHLHSSLFMLCLSILFVNCLYIPFSITKSNLSERKWFNTCNIIGFLFHYCLLTSFMWMFIMATIQYMYFVRIFNFHISHFFLKTSFIGWLLPLIFPILVICIDKNGGYTGEYHCWINNSILFYITFILPISIIILCNIILFLLTLKSIYQHDPTILTYQNNRSKLQISASICCFVTIGCTWLFGILIFIQPIFIHQLIFCISNSLQGFLIFLFHVYLSKPKRELWQTFFIQRGFHQRPHSSSLDPAGLLTTITTNSSAANLSNLTRPVKFRFTSRSSTSDSQIISAAINPAFIDKDSNLILRTQTEFLSDRIQKTKSSINNSYA